MRQFPFLRGLVETLAFAALVPALWLLFWSLNTFGPLAHEELRLFVKNLEVFLRADVSREPMIFSVATAVVAFAVIPRLSQALQRWVISNKLRAWCGCMALAMIYSVYTQASVIGAVTAALLAVLFTWHTLSEGFREDIERVVARLIVAAGAAFGSRRQ